MIVFRSLRSASDGPAEPSRVVTPGFFDGLHRGHQSLLRDLSSWAREVGGAPAVVTFAPHPRKVLSGSAPPEVHSPEHRLLLLEREGVAAALVLEFDLEVSRWSPEQFVERVVVGALGARRLLLGFDSAVGHRRRGTFEYLAARAERLGVEVRRSSPLVLAGERVSSTLVRTAVVEGNLARVEEITGRPHAILGEVVHGDHRGKGLGFPTANLRIGAEAVLPGGVYFARVDEVVPPGTEPRSIAAASGSGPLRDRPALVNIGRRPTFTGRAADPARLPRFDPAVDRVEVHVLDHDGDLYGRFLEARFYRRQRDERRFSSAEELVRQIRSDEASLRRWLDSTEPSDSVDAPAT